MLRKTIVTGILTFVFSLPSGSEAADVKTIYLKMDTRDAVVFSKKSPNDKSSFPVTVIDGEKDLTGRISVKGSFTRRFSKRSIMVKLDKGQLWNGERKLAFNSMATDASVLREWLAWDLIHKLGSPAPNVDYIKVFINNQYKGLFLQISWIDGHMFKKLGLGGDGELFHPRDAGFCADLSKESVTSSNECWLKFSPGGFDSLKKLTKQIAKVPDDKFQAFVEKNFDVDSLINWITVNAIVSNSDTYNKNYFLYHSLKKKKWVFIPWDYDLTFGRSYDPGLPFPNHIMNYSFQYYYPPNSGQFNVLKYRLFRNKALYKKLTDRISHVLGIKKSYNRPSFGWFNPKNFNSYVDKIVETTEDAVKEDRFIVRRGIIYRKSVEAIKYYALARYHYLRMNIIERSVFGVHRWTPQIGDLMLEDMGVQDFTKVMHRPLILVSSKTLRKGMPSYFVDDTFGLLMAVIRPTNGGTGGRLNLRIDAEQTPTKVPVSSASKCLNRTWHISGDRLGSVLEGNILMEYIYESSLHNEMGKNAKEDRLVVWELRKGKWRRLPSSHNKVSRTLDAFGFRVGPGESVRLVACSK